MCFLADLLARVPNSEPAVLPFPSRSLWCLLLGLKTTRHGPWYLGEIRVAMPSVWDVRWILRTSRVGGSGPKNRESGTYHAMSDSAQANNNKLPTTTALVPPHQSDFRVPSLASKIARLRHAGLHCNGWSGRRPLLSRSNVPPRELFRWEPITRTSRAIGKKCINCTQLRFRVSLTSSLTAMKTPIIVQSSWQWRTAAHTGPRMCATTSV